MSAKSKAFFLPTSSSARKQMNVIRACIASRIPYNLIGDPGTGKSALMTAIAIEMGYELETVIGRHMLAVDAAGLPIVVHDGIDGPTTVKAKPDWFLRCLREKKVFLFFDEFGNTSAPTQAALLVFVQTRTLGGVKLPDETVIIMASNPVESGSDGHPLTRPMANRIVHGKFDPDPEDWFEGMACNWNEEDVTLRLATERARISLFLRHNLDLLDKGPKEDGSDESGAHPTRRSWDNLAKVLSNTEADDQGTRDVLTEGTVGSDAHILFSVWDSENTLPDIRGILDDPTSFDWAEEEADRVYAVLSIVAALKYTADAERIAHVFIEAGKSGTKLDIGAGLISSVIGILVSLGEEDSDRYLDELTATYMPVLIGAGITAGAR